jgi:hypothetical protein
MGGQYSSHGTDYIYMCVCVCVCVCVCLSENLKEGDHLEDRGVDRRIIL